MTGGTFYKMQDLNDLSDMIMKLGIGKRPVTNSNTEVTDLTDTDEDGIPDVVERGGMRNQYGMIVYTDPEKKDTDGDKLTDGEEIDPTKRNKQFSNIMTLNVPKNADFYYMKSSPNNPDTDNDGMKR